MEKRKPTYGSAVRMAKLVATLSRAWRPIPVNQIAEELAISARTLQRYKKALNEQLSAADGSDFLKVLKDGSEEKWYLSDQEEINNANSFRIVSVFVAKALLKFLKGTVLEAGVKDIWEIVAGQLSPSKKKQLEHFDKKFRYTGFGRKTYEEQDIIVTKILRGLLHQTKLQIFYRPLKKEEKFYVIHPYTLFLHRDSLYLHAYVEAYKQGRTFVVDRIREGKLLDDTFKYPVDYDPDQLTEGSFGIYEAKGKKPFKISVSFKEYLWDYITSRLWHPTQSFLPVKDDRFIMDLYLSNVTEFIPWILQFGKEVIILEPKSLRDAIKNELNLALKYYGSSGFSVGHLRHL